MALAFLLASAAGAAEVVSTITMAGNVAGKQVVARRADGSVAVSYEFNDRGRGPKIDAVYRFGPGGFPVAVETRGNEYMKAPVEERFEVSNGRATWKNRGESGSVAAPDGVPDGYYVSYDGTFEELAMVARAALAAPDRRVALLPAGSVGAEVLETRTVQSATGSSAEIRLVEVVGFDFAPTHFWIDANGDLFAQTSPWLSLVRAGFEANDAELQKPHEERTKAFYRVLAKTIPRRPASGFVVRNARLFDSESKSVHEGWSVAVAGDRIVATGPDAEVVAPQGAESIDARGATLLPGLWDLHTHLGNGDGPLDVAAGVLGVRDLANDVDSLADLVRQWDSGETLGPRVVRAGFLDGPGPYAGPSKALAASFEEAKAWVDQYAELGYVQIKLYSSLKPELVAPIAAYAHSKGLRVSGHIPAYMTAEQAVRAGYDEIQHVNMLFLNFLFDEVQDTRTPARFTAVAEKAVDLDLTSSKVTEFLDLLAERGTVLDPTLSIFENMFLARQGEITPDLAAVADRLPPTVRRGLLGGGLPIADETVAARSRASYRKLLEMVATAWRRGIRVVPGTDNFAGFSLHRELEIYVEAGIPNLDVLQMATLGAARVAGRGDSLGVVRAGRLADFILVAGRPDQTMSDIRKVSMVVKGGAVIDPGAIYRAIGVNPAVAAETSTRGAR